MTFAPDDLKAVQRYCREHTGQEWASLGIIHSTPNGGGYHEGEDLLIAAGRAPGPQYPDSDYSYTDSPRDLLPSGRLAGGDAGSAFDLGGGFDGFLRFNAWMRARLLANDPRTRDVREMIHTLDGQTVRRVDRTGRQHDGGDNSHLTHTHFSFFRDSLGRRDQADNFLGLLREFFEGSTTVASMTEPVPATGKPTRDAGTVLSDLWNQELNGGSGWDGQPSKRQRLLAATASDVAATRSLVEAVRTKLDTLSLAGVDVNALAQAVAAKLAPLMPTAADIARAAADEEAKRLSNG